jgi:putative FmdB family regulatory protein
MPIYCYECSYCYCEFEELRSIKSKSGKSECPKCGNISFKIPATFNTNIYKKRKFADGTETPDHVRTPKQEKAWLKSEGIVLDKPTGREKRHAKEERARKSKTVMEIAYKDALQKTSQGYKVKEQKQREVKSNVQALA